MTRSEGDELRVSNAKGGIKKKKRTMLSTRAMNAHGNESQTSTGFSSFAASLQISDKIEG